MARMEDKPYFILTKLDDVQVSLINVAESDISNMKRPLADSNKNGGRKYAV